MAAHAFAIANNDIVHIGWSFDEKIPDCIGFSIWRLPPSGANGSDGEPLTSLPTFVTDPESAGKAKEEASHEDPDPADVAPHLPKANAQPALIKEFKWRDLLAPTQRGGTYRYRIVAMGGTQASPKPIAGVAPLVTEPVTSTPHLRGLDAYFNRGILSTQALARSLTAAGGVNVNTLQAAIKNADNKIRHDLEGQLQDGVLSLLAQRAQEGGDCYAALYELTDDFLITQLEAAKNKLHIVLSNNTGDNKKAYDAANQPARQRLAKSGAELISRYLPDGRSIGHNKFMVYVDKAGNPQAVLTGSTNWTASGLCTQNNNCLIVRSPDLAKRYLDYWHNLKEDTEAAGIPAQAKAVPALQGKTLRTEDAAKPSVFHLPGSSATIEMWPSPNTTGFIPKPAKGADAHVPPPAPPDMAEMFGLIGGDAAHAAVGQAIAGAKQGVLLLVFQPGSANNDRSWTIVKQLAKVGRDKPGLFIRGAISDEAEALEFEADRNNKMDCEMVAPAGILKKEEAWMAEIYKAGHAIVHDKILVIDPFSDDCVVITGSHNLGYKASYNNDENLVIVRGHRPLAEAYAAHCADVFEHYRWRWYQKRDAERHAAQQWVTDGSNPATANDKKYATANFYNISNPQKLVGDKWQDRYFDPASLASLERQFWAGGGQPLPARAANGHGMTSGLTAAESAFRAAKATLRKQSKNGHEAEGAIDTSSEGTVDNPTIVGDDAPAPKKHAGAKKKATKKKAAKKKKR
jgi:phosphatidylserine/phosphatidylglycerophosphate/cardiolipin synthase-like enzyme